MSDTFLFTSESVNEGHPGKKEMMIISDYEMTIFTDRCLDGYAFIDKICDQVSDAVLDACVREDPASRVACG